MSRRVAVIGAGVIGLSIAHELARHGDRVEVIADFDTGDTVSAVAGALWFPYRSERSPAADEMLQRSLARFLELADQSDTGVHIRAGRVLERRVDADRSWTAVLSRVEEVPADRLPPGVMSGVRARLPMIVVPEYLSWLRAQLIANGVSFSRRTVGRLEDLVGGPDLVVIAAGIRGGELLGGDPAVYPVRGQVVRLSNPGLVEWVTDDDHPEGVTYVFPRTSDVIIGGAAVVGSWDADAHPDVEAAIINRAQQLVPALRGQAVLGRAAGLRPARATVRVERVQSAPLATIAAYGHGGAGFTLSWGTAERVRALSAL